MQIIKQVKVKQVITEKSRSLLISKFEQRLDRLEQENQQLIFEQKRMERNNPLNRHKVITKFQKEINERKKKQAILQNQIETIHNLPIESEIVEREVQALVNIEIGMDWSQVVTDQVIVVKNDKIIRIDEVGEKNE
ncbi:YlqD family protein [Paraliobacillus sp. JSM ZJ581]|uniref:YlqD family protein n=1 Tax=Paraliobacillus sp. JSM ZJ581 TaxID=3342118 RepID=UPI0035A98CF3